MCKDLLQLKVYIIRTIFYFFEIKSRTPLINVRGWIGHPGIYKSIGYFSRNSLLSFEEFWNIPPEIAQAPANITILGFGVDL